MNQTQQPKKLTSFTKEEIHNLFSRAVTCLRHTNLDIRKAPAAQPYGKLLLVIPRIVGSAPTRNKMRRRLKSIFYQHKIFDRGYDLIIIVKKGAIDLPFNDLEQILLSATQP